MSFLFSNIGTLQQCEERTFLQKRGAHACVFGVLGAVCYLCIHFCKNARTHSHFRDIKCTFCGNFFVLGVDDVYIILKMEHELFFKEKLSNISFTTMALRCRRKRSSLRSFLSKKARIPF